MGRKRRHELVVSSSESPRKFSRRRLALEARTHSPRDEVLAAHASLAERTEDAHNALVRCAHDTPVAPLNVRRLRRILEDCSKDGPLGIDRPNQWGRTMLVECSAAKYSGERVILRCARELVESRGACVNVRTRMEHPDADRTAVFFAVARLMPALVRYLVEAGADLSVVAAGRLRLVSDPNRSIRGTFTPLEFARALRWAETGRGGGEVGHSGSCDGDDDDHDDSVVDDRVVDGDGAAAEARRGYKLDRYYISKLNAIVRLLENAEAKLRDCGGWMRNSGTQEDFTPAIVRGRMLRVKMKVGGGGLCRLK